MSLNKSKLAICLGLLSGIAAPFVTGSVSLIASFPEAQFQARKQYTVAAFAAASGQSLEQQYTQYLGSCRMAARDRCDDVRGGIIREFIRTLGACSSGAETEINCMRAWSSEPPSNSFLAHANAFMMAAPTLLSTARDFAAFFAFAYAATMLWRPFIRWIKT
jgi:hypothetical protein